MALPPAIVLGVDTPIGLAVVRELGERGVDVHGIGRDRRAIGLSSRRLARGYLRTGSAEGDLELLQRISRESGARLLLAIAESDILFLQRNASRLGDVRALVPDAERMAVVLDKDRTCARAAEVGIEVPAILTVRDAADIGRVAEEASYPAVLKWSDPHGVHPLLSRAKITLEKVEYAHDPKELAARLRRYADVGAFPLVQSFCPGHGMGQMVFLHKGEPLLAFEHRRIHEWPPEGGFSTVCESVAPGEHPALMEKSVMLLRSIGWEGAAMVEYRFDPKKGRAVLMEVNGRFWGSLPLAYHAGAPFAWLTYSVLGLNEVPPVPPYRAGVRCRYMIPETKRVFRVLFQRGRIRDRAFRAGRLSTLLGYLADFFRPRTRYYVFRWADPGPLLADIAGAARRLFSRR
jgi:predicted ATP-grasp superfamily ATP-dependent carboligase